MSRRDQLALVLAADRPPGDRVAAVGAAQIYEHHMRQSNNAQHAAKSARYVAIGMTTMAVRNGMRPELFQRAVAEIAGEILIKEGLLLVSDAPIWIQLVRDSESAIVSQVHRAAIAVARAALHEHIIDMCIQCQSKKEIPDHDISDLNGRQPMKMCPDCKGTGLRSYSDDERADALRGHVARRYARDRILEAMRIIRVAESIAIEHWAAVLK